MRRGKRGGEAKEDEGEDRKAGGRGKKGRRRRISSMGKLK